VQQTSLRLARMEKMLQKLVSLNTSNKRMSRLTGPWTHGAQTSEAVLSARSTSLKKSVTTPGEPRSVGDAVQGSECQTQATLAKPPIRCTARAATTPAVDMESLTSALESDMAAIFEDLQLRVREFTHAVPRISSEGPSAGLSVDVAHNDVRDVGIKSGPHAVEPEPAIKKTTFEEPDPVELALNEVEAELMNLAAAHKVDTSVTSAVKGRPFSVGGSSSGSSGLSPDANLDNLLDINIGLLKG